MPTCTLFLDNTHHTLKVESEYELLRETQITKIFRLLGFMAHQVQETTDQDTQGSDVKNESLN
jgi:hypothetical protein